MLQPAATDCSLCCPQIGVSAEASLAKMRMMALLALANQASHEEISFEQIQAALDIPAEQVGSAAHMCRRACAGRRLSTGVVCNPFVLLCCLMR